MLVVVWLAWALCVFWLVVVVLIVDVTSFLSLSLLWLLLVLVPLTAKFPSRLVVGVSRLCCFALCCCPVFWL